MLRPRALAAPLFALAVGGCASIVQPAQQEPALPAIQGAEQTPIIGLDGRAIGLLTLAEGPRGVLLRINLLPNALQPGWHGLHIHEKGDCGGEAFTAAGSHEGHGARSTHGLLNPDGPEAGDLPNLLVPLNERPTIVELYAPGVSLTPQRGRANLHDADGAALVIHNGPDDHVSQPIGGAGARIACAVIAPPAGT